MQSILQSNEQSLILGIIFTVLVVAISTSCITLFRLRYFHRSLKTIINSVKDIIESGDVPTHLESPKVKNELSELVEVLNIMLERFQHVSNMQRQFIKDVSHELPKPLESILGELELMNEYGVQQESVEAIQQEALRLNRIIKDLLFLTRADVGELRLEFHPIDLDKIAIAVFEATVNRTKKRNLLVMMNRIESVHMVGDRERIDLLISHLMHNATRFTPDGREVILSVYAEQGEAIIEVEDTGVGISTQSQKQIFNRFFKDEQSRVHLDDSDSVGLGLSIVKCIVDAHYGSIEVESELGKRSLFRVRLPLGTKIKQSDG